MKQCNLVLLTACISLLGVTQNVMALQNGFYLGVNVGIANLMNRESHSVSPESHQLGEIDAIGGGFVGYDFCLTTCNHLAIEAFADAINSQTSIRHTSTIYKMNQRYNLGIRFLPTYFFTPSTMGHLILGYAQGQFRINDNGIYGFIDKSYNRNGFQTGLGLSTALRNNFFVRLDALYTSFASDTKRGKGLPGDPPYQFYTNAFNQLACELGLYYKFC